MKLRNKLALLLMALMITISCMNMTALAADSSQDGLNVTLTTDKDSYAQGEEINVTVTVENTNDYDVENVSVASMVPEDIELKEGSVTTAEYISIAAGSSETFEMILISNGETLGAVVVNTPATGDGNSALAIVLIIATCIVVFYAVAKKNKKLMSLMLCVTVAASTAVSVRAESSDATTDSIELREEIVVADTTYEVSAVVTYDIYEQENDIVVSENSLLGSVVDAADSSALADVNVELSNGSEVVAEAVTDESGEYVLTGVESGDYIITAFAEGYVTAEYFITVEGTDVVYLETIYLVAESDEDGVASGFITNALTGEYLEDVTLSIKAGINNADGETVETTATLEDGSYSVSLPVGNYTVVLTKDGFITSSYTIVVKEGETPNQNNSMSPTEESTDFYRIVLTWGEYPQDLDSHIAGSYEGSGLFHVYYGHRNAYGTDNGLLANLDVDDISSYGPETITVYTNSNETYDYFVHKFAGEGTIATSGAQVKVYRGDALVATYNVPASSSTEVDWHVFKIVNNELVTVNEIKTMNSIAPVLPSQISTYNEPAQTEKTTVEDETEEIEEYDVESDDVEDEDEDDSVYFDDYEEDTEEVVEDALTDDSY